MAYSSNGLGNLPFKQGNAGSNPVYATNTYLCRSTDRTSAFEALNAGSIPAGGANKSSVVTSTANHALCEGGVSGVDALTDEHLSV